MKKVLKAIARKFPIVSLGFILAMFLGMMVDDSSYGHLVINSGVEFHVKEILSNFGHGDFDHFLGNAIYMLVFGGTAEIAYRKKRNFFLSVMGIIVIYFAFSEIYMAIIQDGRKFLGASGWISVMPGLMLTVWVKWVADLIKKERDYGALMLIPTSLMIPATYGIYWDIVSLGSGKFIAHDLHLLGYAIGGMIVFIGAPVYVYKMMRIALIAFRESNKSFRIDAAWQAKFILEDFQAGRITLTEKEVSVFTKRAAW